MGSKCVKSNYSFTRQATGYSRQQGIGEREDGGTRQALAAPKESMKSRWQALANDQLLKKNKMQLLREGYITTI